MSDDDAVEPTDAARTTRSRSIFTSYFTDLVTNFIFKLCRKWSIPYSCRIRFRNTDDIFDFSWPNSCPDGHSSCNRVRRRDKWVRSLVNIQHNTLCSLEQNTTSPVKCIV